MVRRRDWIAEAMEGTGLIGLLEAASGRPQIIALGYHRIGRATETIFDRELYLADAEGLDAQIKLLKRRCQLLHPAEALEIVSGRQRLTRTAALITFDDGYIDNLEVAVPVLEANDASALFFMVTGYADHPQHLPWWDRIAFLVRQCIGRRLEMSEPDPWAYDVTEENVDRIISALLWRYRNFPVDQKKFVAELAACAAATEPPAGTRVFIGWEGVREMLDRGMCIGLHTHSHEILSKLDPETQIRDLSLARARYREVIGRECEVMAYPVGTRNAFTTTTKSIAQQTGYKYAFSLYGGTNIPGKTDPYDIRRVTFPSYASMARCRAAVSVMALTRRLWL